MSSCSKVCPFFSPQHQGGGLWGRSASGPALRPMTVTNGVKLRIFLVHALALQGKNCAVARSAPREGRLPPSLGAEFPLRGVDSANGAQHSRALPPQHAARAPPAGGLRSAPPRRPLAAVHGHLRYARWAHQLRWHHCQWVLPAGRLDQMVRHLLGSADYDRRRQPVRGLLQVRLQHARRRHDLLPGGRQMQGLSRDRLCQHAASAALALATARVHSTDRRQDRPAGRIGRLLQHARQLRKVP